MNNSRSKNLFLNVFLGYIAQIGVMILSFVGRRNFLNFLSVEYLGVNGLYTNILTVLSLAELGLDTAVVYSLYKPVAEGNKVLINSLLRFFRKIYVSLAIVVFVIGIALIPVLKYIINSDFSESDLIIYYILFLINTVASYFMAHKVALLSAYQETRIHKIILLSSNFILQIMHIVVLVIWCNYYIYIITNVFVTILNNIILNFICNRRYKDIFNINESVDFDKKSMIERIFSTFLYKVGAVAVNNTDNILISVLISTKAVGLYSNYYTVVVAIQGLISTITNALMGGLGNLSAIDTREKQHRVFNVLLMMYHLFASIIGIGMLLLFNEFIIIWLGTEYVLDKYVVFAIAFNFYVTNATAPIWMYREANGMFNKVKYLMFIRAGVNLTLSIVLGKIFGVFGILFATVLSLFFTSIWYEPQLLFREIFQKSPLGYFISQIKYVMLTIASFIICSILVSIMPNGLLMVFIKAILIAFMTSLLFASIKWKSDELKYVKDILKGLLKINRS